MPDQDGYPTEEELQKVRDWDTVKDIPGWLDYIHDLWWYADWGWREYTDKDGSRILWVSTAGWSGNESVIDAMQDNFIGWHFTWQSTNRGGHYLFVLKQRSVEKHGKTLSSTNFVGEKNPGEIP